MDIVYSSSDVYSICTGVSLYSLYKNNKEVEELNVHILSTDISDINKERLKCIANQFGRKIEIIDAKQDFIDEAQRLNLTLLRGAYNTYSRVVLNRWFSYLEKIMVIDSDTMVTGSLKEAWDFDIRDYMLAAVPEIAMYTQKLRFEDPVLLAKLDTYYNMGICVVNLKKWRDENVDELIYSSIHRDHPCFRIADQSIINTYLAGKIARLPLKFNYYSPVHNVSYETICNVFSRKIVFTKTEFLDALNNPSIIHYFGHPYERPWYKYSEAIRKNEYLRLREETPWKGVELNRWGKSPSIVIRVYDIICYCLLKAKMYDSCLKFRYLGGQYIKSILGIRRVK